MVLLGQTVGESVDFTVGMREAVGSNVGDGIIKQDRIDAGLRVGCIVGALRRCSRTRRRRRRAGASSATTNTAQAGRGTVSSSPT